MKSNNQNKVTFERKISSLTVIQVQVYRPRVMEPHIDEGSLILWSSSLTLMNTKKTKKTKNKKTKNKKQNKTKQKHEFACKSSLRKPYFEKKKLTP